MGAVDVISVFLIALLSGVAGGAGAWFALLQFPGMRRKVSQAAFDAAKFTPDPVVPHAHEFHIAGKMNGAVMMRCTVDGCPVTRLREQMEVK